MNSPRVIPNLEIHLTHSCNLDCESCSHYSNQRLPGMLSPEEADDWMQRWNLRLAPQTFSLLGGEPTLNPRLCEHILLARKRWPQSVLRLVTNGFFLDRHPRLPTVLRETQTWLSLSIHHNTPEYQEKLKPILHLLGSWKRLCGINVIGIESYKNWTRRYHGYGKEMEPFQDKQPRSSWEHCPARYCSQLFDGKIWKCAPIAYLQVQNAKYPLSAAWKPYLDYQPLSADCTEDEIRAFFDREEEPCCSMCPASPERFLMPLPLRRSASSSR